MPEITLKIEDISRSTQGKLLMTLDDESKRRIDELIGKLESCAHIAPRNVRTRTECVRQMFVEVLPNQERNDRPTVPSEAAIRLQTRIDAEEFVEKIEALYDDPSAIGQLRVLLLQWVIGHSPIRKDLHDRLPEFADALADNVVTNEGFAVLFGIDLESVFQEVHKSNMAKKGGPIDEYGKLRKPDGWTAPDVAGVLRFQGWQPSSESKVDEPIPYRVAESAPTLSCEIHGFISGGYSSCVRCENARYNGSEVDPIGESDEDDRVQEEPQVLMLGATTVSEKYGDPTYLMIFSTNDTTVAERCKLYMQNRTKVIPEPVGMRAYPVSFVVGVYIRPAVPSDAVLGRRYSIQIDFRKVD